MSDSLLLTGEELFDLTGFRQSEKQRDWLGRQGVPYRMVGRRVLVARGAAEEWLRHDVPTKLSGGGFRLDLVR